MGTEPLLVETPADMLAKAERELLKLRATVNADTVFNFFVTAYHVIDYVKNLGTVHTKFTDALDGDPAFDMCKNVCNRGKHLVLTRPPKTVASRTDGGCGLGMGALGEGPLSSLPMTRVFVDGKEFFPLDVAEKVMAMWRKFFADHGIPT